MAEQLDVSNIITNNVKEYLNPKNKIYRLNLAEAEINYENDDITLETKVILKIIEVIDDNKEYEKLMKDAPVCFNSTEDHFLEHGNKFLKGKVMYQKCSCMSKEMFDILIKYKKIGFEDDFNIILLDYKQLA